MNESVRFFSEVLNFIVSDDIHAMPELKLTNTSTLFSTHLLYYLFRAGMIS